MVVATDRLSVAFGSEKILDGVTLNFPSAGVVGLVGPNGCGKSTLLDVLSGFRRASGGSVLIDERPARMHALLRVCCRLHQPVVLPHQQAVEDYLACVTGPWTRATRIFASAEARKFASSGEGIDQEAQRTIELAGVSLGHSTIGQCSWGQQRIIATVAVLNSTKPVLLLDEPFAGLAEPLRRTVSEQIASRGKTKLVIVVEHDLATLAGIADRMLLLHRGSIICDARMPDDTDELHRMSRFAEARKIP